jgi:hypothetical protein
MRQILVVVQAISQKRKAIVLISGAFSGVKPLNHYHYRICSTHPRHGNITGDRNQRSSRASPRVSTASNPSFSATPHMWGPVMEYHYDVQGE